MLPKALDDTLGFNLYRTSQLFRRELASTLAAYGLTPEQWQVIVALGDRTLRQADLTEATLKDRPTISRMLRRMEQGDWIERPVGRDGRSRLVRLTRRGQGLREDVLRALDGHLGRRLHSLSADDKRHLLELLKQLRRVLGDGPASNRVSGSGSAGGRPVGDGPAGE